MLYLTNWDMNHLLALVFSPEEKWTGQLLVQKITQVWPVGTNRVWEMLVHVEFPPVGNPLHVGGCEGITPKCPQIPCDGGNYPKWGEEEAILYDFFIELGERWFHSIKNPLGRPLFLLKTSRKKSWVDQFFEEMFHPDEQRCPLLEDLGVGLPGI